MFFLNQRNQLEAYQGFYGGFGGGFSDSFYGFPVKKMMAIMAATQLIRMIPYKGLYTSHAIDKTNR